MNTVDRTSVVGLRIDRDPESPDGDLRETDTFIEAEYGGERYVDLHISPRTDDVITCSLSIGEAWRLCRELARAAAAAENADV